MHRAKHRLGLSDCERFQRRFSPSNLYWKPCKVDSASVAGVATQIVCRSHKNTIDRTRLDAQRAKQAFSVVNDKFGQLEALLFRRLLFADFNTVGWTSSGTGFASDARRQVKSMVAAKALGHSDGKLRELVLLGKGPSLGIVGSDPVAKAHPKSLRNRRDGYKDVAKPG